LVLKKILFHSLIYAVGPQLPKIASLFVLPIITKYLTPLDYGIWGLITAYLSAIGFLGDLGLSVILVNTFFKYPNRWQIIWKQLHGFLIIWSLVFALMQGLLLYFVIPYEAETNLWFIILSTCIPTAFFNSTYIIGARYYQFAQKPIYIAIISAIVGSLAILINLYTIAYLKLGYIGWYISSLITSCLTFIAYTYPVYFKYKLGPILRFRKKFILPKLKVSLPTIPHAYSSYLINSSDRVIMKVLGIKINSLGQYNIAYTFGSYFEFFGEAVGMAVGPFYSKLYAQKTDKSEDDLVILTFSLQILFIGAAFLVSLWAKELFDILINNDELKTAYPLAIIIIMGYCYRPMYWTTVNRLAFNDRTNSLWRISLLAGVINVILNLISIPIFGLIAAAVNTFISLLFLGFSGFYMKTYREIAKRNYFHIFWLISILSTSVFVYLIQDSSILTKTVITLTVFLSLSIALYKNYGRIKLIEI